MIAALLALALGAGAAAAPSPKASRHGVLLLAYGGSRQWKAELGVLRAGLKGVAVESVETASDPISVQKAVDRLVRQRVDKIVGVPLETIGESTLLDQTRYLFGIRKDWPADRPDGPARGRPPKRIKSPVPLALADAMDRSPLLAQILADRARALIRDPAKESLVLAGIAPRSDAAARAWHAAAQAVAESAGKAAGFPRARAVGVRDAVRSSQKDKDVTELRAAFRELTTAGRVVVVPLSPATERVGKLLKRDVAAAYRWDGKGVLGDRRLLDWVKSSADAAAKLPDSRQYQEK